MPRNWDQSILYAALQAVRSDPSCAHGYAPAEILLGRQLVYPIELKKKFIDFDGVNMTAPLVKKLMAIHNETFGIAAEKIKKFQKQYKKKYDKRNQVKTFSLKVGDKVQYKIHKSRKVRGKPQIKFFPTRGYLLIHKICPKIKKVILKDKEGKIQKRKQLFDRVREYTGVF